MSSSQKEQFALHVFRDGLPIDEAAKRAGMPDGPTPQAKAHLASIQSAMRAAFTPRSAPRPYLTGQHRARLQELTAQDEEWTTLAGHLYDPEAMNGDVCPDPLAEYVAHRFVFTSLGRLFFLKQDGECVERSPNRRGQFNIRHNGERWQPTRKCLMRRVYPEVLHGDHEYDPEGDPREWMEHLQERVYPEGAAIKKRCATEQELEHMPAWMR